VTTFDIDVAGNREIEAGESGSGAGRGGMRSKVDAATIAARSGCHAVIASGVSHGALERVLSGEQEGTWFPAKPGMPARQRWIAWAAAPRGALHLDAGAVKALRERGASLLAAGVTRVDGSFRPGDVVELRDPNGELVGRGIIGCDADVARRWRNGERPDYARNHHALVNRDHLVLEPSLEGS
jgi:glutamate 5-kinase